jgi:LacI family transcriptional regulator
MITINEIAKLANVSKSTVSKALNNRSDVGEETKIKIQQIARQHNFTPSAIAKGFRKRVTENIGVIFRREERSLSGNPFYSRVLEGIEEEALPTEYNLLLHLVPDSLSDLPNIARKKQVDGILLIGTHNKMFVENLRESQIPMVLVDPGMLVDGCYHVLIDNENGAFMATKYLIESGHQKIGFISGDISRLSFFQRLQGYLKALQHHHIPVSDCLIKNGDMEKGYELAKSLLATDHPPTAIFASHDINAIHAYKAIQDLGLKVRDDISVIGFDDIDLSRMVTPNLSTIRVFKKKLGSLALQKLHKIMNGEKQVPVNSVVPVELVERDSVKRVH